MGVEEAMDVGVFIRGCFGVFSGLPMNRRDALTVMEEIPMTSITDAKDTYDRSNSDTNTQGAQKSLAFGVAWIRSVLGGANTQLKWTATANMWVDAGTKAMPLDHMHRILESGKWCYVYHTDYVKQAKKKKATTVVGDVLPGEPLNGNRPIFPFLQTLSKNPGWHQRPDMVVHVAEDARSFRIPDARYGAWRFPLRTTYGRYDLTNGRSEWRILETGVDLSQLTKRQELLSQPASCLVSVFRSRINKRKSSAEVSCEHDPS